MVSLDPHHPPVPTPGTGDDGSGVSPQQWPYRPKYNKHVTGTDTWRFAKLRERVASQLDPVRLDSMQPQKRQQSVYFLWTWLHRTIRSVMDDTWLVKLRVTQWGAGFTGQSTVSDCPFFNKIMKVEFLAKLQISERWWSRCRAPVSKVMEEIRGYLGWSHRVQEHRVTVLPGLSLQNEPMAKRMQENQDLILLPATWWPLTMDTLEPNESGWWYKVSDPIRFRECKACSKRIGEDVQTGHKTINIGSWPKCPVGKPKHEHSTRRKQCGDVQEVKDKIREVRRSLRLNTQVLPENVYCELDEENAWTQIAIWTRKCNRDTFVSQQTQEVWGGTGGEPTIIRNSKTLETGFWANLYRDFFIPPSRTSSINEWKNSTPQDRPPPTWRN